MKRVNFSHFLSRVGRRSSHSYLAEWNNFPSVLSHDTDDLSCLIRFRNQMISWTELTHKYFCKNYFTKNYFVKTPVSQVICHETWKITGWTFCLWHSKLTNPISSLRQERVGNRAMLRTDARGAHSTIITASWRVLVGSGVWLNTCQSQSGVEKTLWCCSFLFFWWGNVAQFWLNWLH